jgi:hypothetical protein
LDHLRHPRRTPDLFDDPLSALVYQHTSEAHARQEAAFPTRLNDSPGYGYKLRKAVGNRFVNGGVRYASSRHAGCHAYGSA